jgi:hypothetical protein
MIRLAKFSATASMTQVLHSHRFKSMILRDVVFLVPYFRWNSPWSITNGRLTNASQICKQYGLTPSRWSVHKKTIFLLSAVLLSLRTCSFSPRLLVVKVVSKGSDAYTDMNTEITKFARMTAFWKRTILSISRSDPEEM